MTFCLKLIFVLWTLQGTALFANECQFQCKLIMRMSTSPGPCSPEDRIRLICDVPNCVADSEVKFYGSSSSDNSLIIRRKNTEIQGECKTVRTNICQESSVNYSCCIEFHKSGVKGNQESCCSPCGHAQAMNNTGNATCDKDQDIFRPCLPVDNPDDISGNSNVPAIIGCVLGALILVIISAILVLQFMRMFRRRRLNHLSQGRDNKNDTESTTYNYSARLPGETSPYERAVTNIMASQDGHLYAQLEAEDACRAGVSYYREQHVYEDAEKYFKAPGYDDYANPNNDISGKRANETHPQCNVSPLPKEEGYANPIDDISGKRENETQPQNSIQKEYATLEELKLAPGAEEHNYDKLERDIPAAQDYEKMPGDRRNSDALELGKKPGEPAVIQTDLATSSPDSVLVELPLNNGSIAGYSHSRPDNEQTIDDTTDAA